MPSVYSRILAGELPAAFVWEDERAVAFLSINPIRTGHTLVVPRREIESWLECEDDLRDHLFAVAQRVGRALDAVWGPPKVGLMIAGLEVAHVHVHVIPVWGPGDLAFANASPTVDPASLEPTAALIRGALPG